MPVCTTFDDRITMHIVTAHHEIELLHPNVVFESYNEDVIRTGSQQVNRVTSDLDRVLLNAMTLLAAWDHATAYRASDEYKERVAREEAEKEARAQAERAAFEAAEAEVQERQAAEFEEEAYEAQLDQITRELAGGDYRFSEVSPLSQRAILRIFKAEMAEKEPVDTFERLWGDLFSNYVTPDSVWARIAEFGK